jgi:exopolyphosphatase/guanosine-5'-triphosphate,3'-diphosphate pyrophosphatase
MKENPGTAVPVAVIDIGSSAIRLSVAEIGAKSAIRQIENMSKPVSLGQDVFSAGRITQDTMRESLAILANYREVITNYGIQQVHAIATSAVRDAANRDNFVDKVFIRTGIDVEVLEGMEENRLLLMAVEHALSGAVNLQKACALVIEVGAGTTEITLLEKGRVVLSRSLPLGSIRLPQNLTTTKFEHSALPRVLKRNLRMIIEDFSRDFNPARVDTFIAVGGDMRAVAREAGRQAGPNHAVLSSDKLLDFVKNLAKYPPEETARRLSLSYRDAELIYPSMLIYSAFLAETQAKNILVPMANIREGVLLEVGNMVSGNHYGDISRQVISSARGVGKKYRYDEDHAHNVAANALRIYDALQKEHGLSPTERMLLEIAALLHDIGTYVSPSSHHKHSMYLIEAAEIFGLRKAHKDIVANVVRYHRRSLPKSSHEAYMALSRQDRTIVAKLAAILRVADALDNSHQQRIKDLRFKRREDNYLLQVPDEAGDISLEKQSLLNKSDFFIDIYGYPITVRQVPSL